MKLHMHMYIHIHIYIYIIRMLCIPPTFVDHTPTITGIHVAYDVGQSTEACVVCCRIFSVHVRNREIIHVSIEDASERSHAALITLIGRSYDTASVLYVCPKTVRQYVSILQRYTANDLRRCLTTTVDFGTVVDLDDRACQSPFMLRFRLLAEVDGHPLLVAVAASAINPEFANLRAIRLREVDFTARIMHR